MDNIQTGTDVAEYYILGLVYSYAKEYNFTVLRVLSILRQSDMLLNVEYFDGTRTQVHLNDCIREADEVEWIAQKIEK